MGDGLVFTPEGPKDPVEEKTGQSALEAKINEQYEASQNQPLTEHPDVVVKPGRQKPPMEKPKIRGAVALVDAAGDPLPPEEVAVVNPADNEVAILHQKLIEAQARADAAVAETARLREQHATLGDGSLSRKEEINVMVGREVERLGRGLSPDEMEVLEQSVDAARKARNVARNTKDSEYTPHKPPKKAVTDAQVRGRDSEYTPHKPPRTAKPKGWVRG